MSAGRGVAGQHTRPSRDMTMLAPLFAGRANVALARCEDAGLDAFVYEAHRSDALQAIYYARGRTVIPPEQTVTNARNSLNSWHGYGLAVDVISRSRLWSPEEVWWEWVAEIFVSEGMDWGGHWRRPDRPHFQWGGLRASPSDRARLLMRSGGFVAVWREVGAW